MLTTWIFDLSTPSCLAKNSNITKLVVEAAAASCLPSRSLTVLISGREVTTVPQIVEQIEQVLHLDAARVGEADGEHRGAAADLELAGVELRGVGIGRPLDEFDVEAVRGIEVLALITGGMKAPSEGKPNTTMVTLAGACAAAGAGTSAALASIAARAGGGSQQRR